MLTLLEISEEGGEIFFKKSVNLSLYFLIKSRGECHKQAVIYSRPMSKSLMKHAEYRRL